MDQNDQNELWGSSDVDDFFTRGTAPKYTISCSNSSNPTSSQNKTDFSNINKNPSTYHSEYDSQHRNTQYLNSSAGNIGDISGISSYRDNMPSYPPGLGYDVSDGYSSSSPWSMNDINQSNTRSSMAGNSNYFGQDRSLSESTASREYSQYRQIRPEDTTQASSRGNHVSDPYYNSSFGQQGYGGHSSHIYGSDDLTYRQKGSAGAPQSGPGGQLAYQQHPMYQQYPMTQQLPGSSHIMNSRSGVYMPMPRGVVVPPRPPLSAGPVHYNVANNVSIRGPQQQLTPASYNSSAPIPGTGGSNAQGRAINKMLLDVLKSRMVDPNRLALIVDANIERMDCVNLATLLFHTGKKRLLLTPLFIKRIATRFSLLKEELRAREASNALYGLKCMSSDSPEVRQLVLALAHKVSQSSSELVAQAVGNAIYGCQMMTSDHEEVRFLLQVLAVKVMKCTELLEAQNVGNALYGLRGMNSDYKEVRLIISALTPKIATAKEELNGQALGNSLYGLQCMSAKEPEIRNILMVLADKANKCWENLKAQEVGNLLYGLKRMSSDIQEVRTLVDAIVPKIYASPDILDAQAIGNSFYGIQNMKSDNPSVLALLKVMAEKVAVSVAELDGQAMGNSLYGLQGMKSECEEVRAVVRAITLKLDSSSLEMNAQELGNALYGLQNMTSDYPEVRSLLVALARKVASSKHDLTSQEIGNAIYGLQGMRSDTWETRLLVRQLSLKISRSTALLDPQGIANSLYGFQRMSSEAEEVRLLIQALCVKIEQSWKLLNAQHVANSLYGLQNLSSFEMEVSSLVRVLVPKIISCRDEMTSKQISCAFFGLQSMYSHSEDVIALIVAMTEKVSLSKDIMTGLQLGSALFGLQGLDDSTTEVRKLVAAFANKINNNVKDLDPQHLGNCFYGLQRMSTVSPEVSALVGILAQFVRNLVTKEHIFGPLVCGNILYGLQNCSWEEQNVHDVVQLISEQVKSFTTNCMNGLEFSSHFQSLEDDSTGNLDDIISLYQSLTLSLSCFPGTEVDQNLKSFLRTQQSMLLHIIENRKHEKTLDVSRTLTIPQVRLAEGIKIILNSEPYEVTTGELLWGFETTAVVTLKRGVKLSTTLGTPWNPVLNVEILGSSHTFPSRDLFTRLRNRHLFEERGVTVEMVHATMVASPSFGKGPNAKKGMIDTLRAQDTLLQALYPPSMEDAALFAKVLFNQGITGPQGIMSSLLDTTTDQLIEKYRSDRESSFSKSGSNSNSFFAIGTLDTSPSSFDGFTGVTSYEYVDDNLENDGLGYNRPINLPAKDIRSPWRVMNAKWIGDHPKISSPMNLSSPRNETPRNSSSTTPQTTGSGSSRTNVFNFASVPLNNAGTQPTGPILFSEKASSNKYPYNMSYDPYTKSLSNEKIATNSNPASLMYIGSDIGMKQPQTHGSNSSLASVGSTSSDTVTLSLPPKMKSMSPQSSPYRGNSLSNLGGVLDSSDVDETISLDETVNNIDYNFSGTSSVASSNYSAPGSSASRFPSTIRQIPMPVYDSKTLDDATTEVTEGEVSDEIALLEAQLEIAKIEAKLLKLRKGTNTSSANSRGSNTSGNREAVNSKSSSPGINPSDGGSVKLR